MTIGNRRNSSRRPDSFCVDIDGYLDGNEELIKIIVFFVNDTGTCTRRRLRVLRGPGNTLTIPITMHHQC